MGNETESERKNCPKCGRFMHKRYFEQGTGNRGVEYTCMNDGTSMWHGV